MNIGPVQIRWTKTVKLEQVETQVKDLRRNRCIAGQYHDIQALRGTVERLRLIVDAAARRQQLRARKTPKGAGASI